MSSEQETPGCEGLEIKICPLPEGNATAFPYQLTIFAAWMLERGIEDYARQIVQMYEWGEDASYCLMMTDTATKEARKLREWAYRVDPEYLEGTIQAVDRLLGELAAQRDRFAALASKDAEGGEKAVYQED